MRLNRAAGAGAAALVGVGSKRRILVSAALMLCAVTGLSACSGDQEPEATRAAGFDRSAEINLETGTIVLPVERFMPSRSELDELMSARALAMAECSTEQGLPTTYEPVHLSQGSDRRYGVWFRPEAERFGYGLPDLDSGEPEVADGGAVGALEGESALQIYEECGKSPDVASLNFEHISPAFDYQEVFGGVTEQAQESEAAQEAFADWEACLTENGLQRDTSVSPWAVEGSSQEASEANINIALVDIQCKEDTGYMERMAEAEAAVQAPLIEEHLPELAEMRAEYDSALETAREYLQANAP